MLRPGAGNFRASVRAPLHDLRQGLRALWQLCARQGHVSELSWPQEVRGSALIELTQVSVPGAPEELVLLLQEGLLLVELLHHRAQMLLLHNIRVACGATPHQLFMVRIVEHLLRGQTRRWVQ